MTKHILSLGGYHLKSDFNPVSDVSQSKQYDYASHSRHKGVELLQFKGRKAIEMTFKVEVVIHKEKDLTIIPDLEKLGDAGEKLPLISSSVESQGGFLGDWVITAISTVRTEYVNGLAVSQEATITLKEWAE